MDAQYLLLKKSKIFLRSAGIVAADPAGKIDCSVFHMVSIPLAEKRRNPRINARVPLPSPLGLPLQINVEGDDLIADEEINQVSDEEEFMRCVDDLVAKADELEKKVNEVSEFFACQNRNAPKGTSTLKEKKRKLSAISNNRNVNNIIGSKGGTKKPVDGSEQVAPSKRMQELMRQFGTIMRQISQHKWAGPFMDPVDVKSLRLHDYFKIIKKPMDFSTIRKQMEATNGGGYRTVSDIYADTRLIFTNAMTYNDERSDIHVMAKTLLAKLEEKWLVLWPKVVEEEKRQKAEELEVLANLQVAREATLAKMASDADYELNELNLQLEELREMVVQKCRKWSTEGKRNLGAGLSILSAENLSKALEIISQSNPNFQAAGQVVEFDMDEQSEVTLWRLKFFVKEALELQRLNFAGKAELKRKKVCDGLTKAASKRNKKLPSS